MKVQPYNPAFPQPIDKSGFIHQEDAGLTKREYIAAMVINGVLRGLALVDTAVVAEYSVKIADALIKELNRETHK